MSASPEYPAAIRAEGKKMGMFIHKRRHKVFDPGFGNLLKKVIALDAAGIRLDFISDLQIPQNLPDLLPPIFTLYKKCLKICGSSYDAGISGKKDPLFFPGYGNKVSIFDLAEKQGVKPQDLLPCGKLSQHAVCYKLHRQSLTNLNHSQA